MAKSDIPIPYSLPVLEIEPSTPALVHENKIYARIMVAKDMNGQSYRIRERSGIEVEPYTGKPLECVLEIVKGTFYDPESKELPADVITGNFVAIETGYKFFQELVTIVDGEPEEEEGDGFDSEEYEELESKLFSGWGMYGFGLDVNQDKPMIKTEAGVFLLNEYIFESWIDLWLASKSPEKPVCFVIEELLLHGIKPYEGKWEKKKDPEEKPKRKPGEAYVIGKPRFLEDM